MRKPRHREVKQPSPGHIAQRIRTGTGSQPSVYRIEVLIQAFPHINFSTRRRRKHVSKEIYHQAAELKTYNRGRKEKNYHHRKSTLWFSAQTLLVPPNHRGKVCMLTQVLSHVHLLVTPWTVACQVPLSMGFSRQEYWSEVPLLTSTEVKYKSQNTKRKIVINKPCVSLTPNMIAQLLTRKKEELG